jgi:hypothetical protein
VASSHDIITIGSGWGELRHGEGKYGGAEQVLVIRKTGEKRAYPRSSKTLLMPG